MREVYLEAVMYYCGQNIGCKPDILTAYRPLTVTLFRPALEPGLLCVLACFPSAFLAVRCLQPDRQSGLVQHIDHAALGEGFFQTAKVGVLLAECCQPLPQSGIVGLDVGGVLALVEQDLSEKNNYPNKSEEYMANQVFYQIFFG